MRLFKNFIFIIPARKGSKGIKNKNIVKIKNKKLIEYTFEVINKIPSDRKYLLSDSGITKRIAQKYHVNISYTRTKKLSKDNTKLIDNLYHFDKYINQKVKFEHYVVLQPTSPFRNYQDILKSIKKYLKTKSDSLFSISASLEHPSDCIYFKKNKISYFHKSKKTLRQNFKKSYFINGAIYIFNRKLLKYKKIISNKKHTTFEMPKIRSIDIDDYQDLDMARKQI